MLIKNVFNNEKIEILRDINMECQSGSIVEVIGASGSGKTTLLKASKLNIVEVLRYE